MGDKVKFVTGILLGAILVNFVHRVNTARYPTVMFPSNMVENDVVDIKGYSSARPRTFLAKALDENGQFVMGVYVQGARHRIELAPSRIRYVYAQFGKGKPFRIVLRLHNGMMEVRILDARDSKYEVAVVKQRLNRNVASVTMRGSYSNGFISKGRWNDYFGLPADCGHSQRTIPIEPATLCPPTNRNERITGGSRSDAGAHPWQVSIRNLNQEENTFKHICGGVLIANCWVLTAAHCFTQAEYPEHYRVRVGDYYNGDDVKKNGEFSAYEDSEEVPVNNIIIHGGYWTMPSTRNDIALVRLQNARSGGTCVSFGNFVQPVCLPRSGDQFAESDCVITGWGATEVLQDTDDYPSCLQQATVNLITNQECKRGKMGYPDIAYAGARVLDTMVCAEGTKGTGDQLTDTCQGDSGGPLVCSEGASTNPITPDVSTVWGITSWGEGCGTHYGVYTKIFSFESWMRKSLFKSTKYDPFS